mmetsp:Transcript_7445/g.17636  ORF Transcript_7445/g.17636 Transcript_7445/m.17636 type:complete len:474 (+) Transcript_7445:88-1509(+)|eukprot:CAMPEP_0171061364 /NCGR_PEP_ID=MMETSP0766_2-20121228/4388_1 /TAXON_ID=439317 /ORGANISM="Gambierdiscus australes, Strain CAWD 149" /LENGTH=473 /DNA_ID=CAMNT_0011517041 /DNA_START=1 /DNA_END=1422 /DNA_ORIENTATION=+
MSSGEARPREERACRADKVKECFRQWDKDGYGYISKQELQTLLTKLMPPGESLTKADMDRLMIEVDRNRNGRIEYDEFVSWLTRPGASLQANSDGVEIFDLGAVLQPLFSIYDRNGDGSITLEEFEECHGILQTALTLHPSDGTFKSDPDALAEHARHAFSAADSNGDHRISFDEFVHWQQEALERSGLSNEDLVDLVPALARQLLRIFKLAESNESGKLIGNDRTVLLHITQNVANFAREIYNDEEAGRSSIRGKHHYTNRWSEPPVGLNISRLKGHHLKLVPVPTWGVDNMDLQVLCVPDVEVKDVRSRRWFARINREVTYKSGRREVDDSFYYVYENLNWVDGNGIDAEFDKALKSLPPELRIFCFLKVEANFGIKICWQEIQTALNHCVQSGLLTAQQHLQYNAHMAEMVLSTMRERDMVADMSSKEAEKQEVQRLRAKIVQAPRSVMATLAELGILRVSSVWADVLQA